MKKLILIATLIASPAFAGNPSTDEVKHPFISNGGFAGLCDRLDWTMGWLGDTGVACFSDQYAMRNGYVYDYKTSTWVATN